MLKNKRYIIPTAFLLFMLLTGGFTINSLLNSQSKYAALNSGTSQDSANSQSELNIEESTDALGAQATENKVPTIVHYIVKSGDSLGTISKEFNISINSISESSSISKDSTLKEGQELVFPSVTGVVHKVKSGETLWDISSTYDIDIPNIVSTNNMGSPDNLKIGQEIIIPGVDVLHAVKSDSIKIADSSSTVKKAVSAAAVTAPKIKIASRGSSTTSSSPAVKGSWPARGPITSGFGQRWGEFHKGIDIGASTGSPVYAFADGTVTFSGWNDGGYGYLVMIDHGNGLVTYYGHNSKLSVSSGQHVSQGQRIASVGMTGEATGPHCHFETRKNGVPVNPMNYLR